MLRECCIILKALILSLLLGCSDHKTSIDFEFPEYEPKLIVISGLGPISGGEAVVAWSKPLKGELGSEPPLPAMELYLLCDSGRVQSFHSDGLPTGHFRLAPDRITLREGVDYALEIYFPATGQSIFSTKAQIPPAPSVSDVEATYDENYPDWCNLSYTTLDASGNLGAKYAHVVLQDENGMSIETIGFSSYLLSSNLQPVVSGYLRKQDHFDTFSRTIWRENQNMGIAPSAFLRVAYMSADFARFKREADELGFFSDRIYQTVKPVFGNIKGATGVFGIYNEIDVPIRFSRF